MQAKRFLIISLALTLAMPGSSFPQQAGAPQKALSPLEEIPAAIPSGIASEVFGTYGGARDRFLGSTSDNASSQTSLSLQPLPNLGDGSDGSLTPQAERKLGERVMRNARHDPDYLDDWLVRDYLKTVATRLATAASTQFIGGYMPDFELFAVRDPRINAFALPGGFIGVNSGLVVATHTESELASVLGHEMGHVLQRHIARMIGSSEKTNYLALAGLLFGILAGVLAKSSDLGSAVALGGQAYIVDNQLRFSRSAEREADRVGFQLLTGADYDPYGMPAFFEQLERSSMRDANIPAYAQSHPLTEERIADMVNRARHVPYRQPRQSAEYGFVRTRLWMLQDNTPTGYTDKIQSLRTEIDDQTTANVAANWYGIALGQMLVGQYGEADRALNKARSHFEARANRNGTARSTPSLDVLAADIARRANRSDAAIRLAALAQQRWPTARAAIFIHLQALLAANRNTDAQALAQVQANADPTQPAWWSYLAKASAASGDTLAQYRALAEQFALEGAWPSALQKLRSARDDKTVNFYERSIIDTRLREFEARYQEEQEDQKRAGHI